MTLPRDYPDGYSTALIRQPSPANPQGWPPRFEPQYQRTREVEQSETSRLAREALQARGVTGTIVGLTQRADALIAQRAVAGAGR
jgi:hypothetical protein